MKYLTYPLLFLLLLSHSSQGQESSTERPNILLIVAEDMGRDINPYRDMPFATPGLDALADRGVVFTNAYAAAPSCSSSRASLFTGLMPHANGQIGLVGRGSSIRPGLATFVDALRQLGYFTSATYKLHVDPAPKFDTLGTRCCDPIGLVKDALEAIEYASKESMPWFVMLNLWDTHLAKKDNALKKKNYWKHQLEGLPAEPLDSSSVDLPPYFSGTLDKAHPNLVENVAGYYNAIRRVDHSIASVLQALDAKTLSKKTIIVFTTDHGPRTTDQFFHEGNKWFTNLVSTYP